MFAVVAKIKLFLFHAFKVTLGFPPLLTTAGSKESFFCLLCLGVTKNWEDIGGGAGQ